MKRLVGAKVSGRDVTEVGGIEGWIPEMRIVGIPLELGLLDRALAARGDPRTDQRMIDQLLDGLWNAVLVERIGVLVARDDEGRAGTKAPRALSS